MHRSLLTLAILAAGTASATPFTGNDSKSSAMGNTGVASAPAASAQQFNPALLASYSGEVSFAMTLPSLKVYIDDSTGIISGVRDFTGEGGTIDQFETIDAAAFETAVFGDAETDSMEDVLTNISGDLIDLDNAIDDVNADIEDDRKLNNSSGSSDNLGNLNTASSNLTNDTGILNDKTTVADNEANTLNNVVQRTKSDFLAFDNRAMSLGANLNMLSLSLPRNGLGMGLSISTDTTLGAKVLLNDNDFTEVDLLLDDLTGLTGEANDLSGSMNILAQSNQAVTDHIGELPDPENYDDGQEDPEYKSDLETWGNQLDVLYGDLSNAETDVNTQQDELVNYNGTYYSNGEVNAPELDEFESEIEVVGANVTEFGITLARDFTYLDETFSAGITPKLVSMTIFEKRFGVESTEEEFEPAQLIEENTTTAVTANLDVGIAKLWPGLLGGKVRGGLVIKDMIPQTFESQSGAELSFRPKVRVGAAHRTRWTTLAADFDITENQPLTYGVPTRYLGLGAEFNAFNWFKLRAGYRNNLSLSDSHVITSGIGVTPWGLGLDFSGWFKPKSFDDWDEVIQDAGLVAQFSMEF